MISQKPPRIRINLSLARNKERQRRWAWSFLELSPEKTEGRVPGKELADAWEAEDRNLLKEGKQHFAVKSRAQQFEDPLVRGELVGRNPTSH